MAAELQQAQHRAEVLAGGIVDGERQLDADVLELDALRQAVMATEESVLALRARTDEHEAVIKDARAALDNLKRRAG